MAIAQHRPDGGVGVAEGRKDPATRVSGVYDKHLDQVRRRLAESHAGKPNNDFSGLAWAAARYSWVWMAFGDFAQIPGRNAKQAIYLGFIHILGNVLGDDRPIFPCPT